MITGETEKVYKSWIRFLYILLFILNIVFGFSGHVSGRWWIHRKLNWKLVDNITAHFIWLEQNRKDFEIWKQLKTGKSEG